MEKNDVLKKILELEQFNPTITLTIDDKSVVYNVPNQTTLWRVQTLLTKEPSTIEWLNNIPKNAILLDIGANVGMYSIYAAVVRNANVYAFEPESQNYAMLNKNIYINKLSQKIHAYCAGISDSDGFDSLYLSGVMIGTSCHSLGEEVDFNLKPRKSPYVQGAISFSVDSLIEKEMIPIPDYIKIDVDGFEHKVLEGAIKTLSDPKIKSIIIELNPNIKEHHEGIKLLKELGFRYSQEQVDSVVRTEGEFAGCGEWIFFKD